jgi:hypothetical protein
VQIFAFFDLEGGSAIDRGMTADGVRRASLGNYQRNSTPKNGGEKLQWTAEESGFNLLAVILVFSRNPDSGGSADQQTTSWSVLIG